MNESLSDIIGTLKICFEENEGEVPYFGEAIAEDRLTVIEEEPKVVIGVKPDGYKQPPQSDWRQKSKSLQAPKILVQPHRPAAPASIQLRKKTSPLSLEDKNKKLADLFKNEIGDCHLCPLGDTRQKIVFGVGYADARVMFVGEGPGFHEDRKGEPFIGEAGQLLDKIISAIQLDRTNVYIANIVKCHPMKDPANPELRGNDRPPEPAEWEKCLPFLKKQIEIIEPEIIVALGAPATKALLNTTQGITNLRGTLKEIELLLNQKPFPILPTFHPAALLRNPEFKRPVWEDMKKLRGLLTGA